MNQRDFLLKEIEKVGIIINIIFQKFFRANIYPEIAIEKQLEDTKELLLNEIDFDLDKFLYLSYEELKEYLSTIGGFNIENIDLLADTLHQIGAEGNFSDSYIYIEKSLQLYNICNLISKTFSLEREAKIVKIKEHLQATNNNFD